MSWPKLIRGVLARHVRLFGRAFDRLDYPVDVDPINNGLSVMDPVHLNTHRGILYETQFFKEGVAGGGSIDVLVRVNNRYSVHIRPSFKSEGPSSLFLYRGPTFSAPGTALPVINRNDRVFAREAKTLVYHTPVVTNPGGHLSSTPEFSTSGSQGAHTGGGESEGFNEWVFREGTDYLFRLTNNDGSAKDLWVSLIFYEHELRL